MKKRSTHRNDKHPRCRTQYPLVLIHGIGWKDLTLAEYWYKIPEYLQNLGATVFVTNQDAWNSHQQRAQQVADEISGFIQSHQCDKVNLICHSQGSLDARWLIEKLSLINKYGETVPAKQCIASYTSIGGVHRGSPIADIITERIPHKLRPYLVRSMTRFAKFILHDHNPRVWTAGKELTTEYMQTVFNTTCPLISDENGGISDGIYYQSYATRMRWSAILSLCPGDHLLFGTWLILRKLEGKNDGLVSVQCAKFGRFRGITSGPVLGPGVCHFAQVNQLLGLVCRFKPQKWLAAIVADLKNQGY